MRPGNPDIQNDVWRMKADAKPPGQARPLLKPASTLPRPARRVQAHRATQHVDAKRLGSYR